MLPSAIAAVKPPMPPPMTRIFRSSKPPPVLESAQRYHAGAGAVEAEILMGTYSPG